MSTIILTASWTIAHPLAMPLGVLALIVLTLSAAWLADKHPLARHVLRIGLLGALLVAAAGFAWFAMFSGFREYDDEGCMMMTIRHVLDGRRLYDDFSIAYGPIYYLYRWMLHGPLRLPLSNDIVRLSTVAVWLLTAGILAAVMCRMCRERMYGWALAALCFAGAMLHLEALSAEPGHPQDIVTALVALGLLAGSFAGDQRPARAALFLLGMAGGALLLVKLNVGVLFLLASALAMLISGPSGRAWTVLRTILGAGAVALPAVLVRRHIATEWGLQFCLIVTLGTACAWLASARKGQSSSVSPAALLWWSGGFVLAAATGIAFAMLRGSTIGGIVHNVLVRPMSYTGAFVFPIPLSAAGKHYAAAGTLLAALYVLRRGRWGAIIENVAVPAMKLVMAVAILAQCARWTILPYSAGWYFDFVLPFLWLTLTTPGRDCTPGELFFRRLITFTACLQVLQMYPVPGSQLAVGTAVVPAIASLWLADVLETARQRAPWLAESRIVCAAHCLPSLIAIGLLAWFAQARLLTYQQNDPVKLAGFRWTRLPEYQAALYRCLADSVQASADTFVCNSGLNSLYFWTQRRPASLAVIGNAWDLFDEAENADLLERNRRQPNLMYLDRGWMFMPPKKPAPLLEHLKREFVPLGRVGPFQLSVRAAEREHVTLRSGAQAMGGTGELRVFDPSRRKLVAAAAEATGDRTYRMYELALPEKLAGRRITRVMLVDLLTGRILADTANARRRLLLANRQEGVLLGAPKCPASVRAPQDANAWLVALPAAQRMHLIPWPAVRLYAGNDRVATIPVVVAP